MQTMCHQQQPALPDNVIREFTGDYHFLADGFMAPLYVEGVWYPSATHAYVALKTLDPSYRQTVSALRSPQEARRFERQLPLRADWTSFHAVALFTVLVAKFRVPALAEQLLATGDRYLEDTSTAEENSSGIDTEAERRLRGHLLMAIRDQIRYTRQDHVH